MNSFLFNRNRCIALSVTLLTAVMLLFSCGTTGTIISRPAIEHRDGDMEFYRKTLALRFAPRLYLHPDERYEIIGIIPVFHPEKPVIAYHIFFEEDALFAGRGTEVDHEILWVEYDPVTFKVSDVATYWHRTVLRTDTCLVNAKASQQRPKAFIQWGQHGLLPLGWETLGARPRAELWAHHQLVMKFTRIPGVQDVDSKVTFTGPFEEYITFTEEVDAADYVKNQEIIVNKDPYDELESRIKPRFGTFSRKKDWPWWSPR